MSFIIPGRARVGRRAGFATGRMFRRDDPPPVYEGFIRVPRRILGVWEEDKGKEEFRTE